MADVFWVGGRQRQQPAVKTLTVTTAATDGAITVTVGGRKSVAVTPASSSTSAAATALQAALAACTEPEFTEITWTVSGSVVTITGPLDGAPITVSKSDGGSNVTALATVTAPTSPYDAADALNYLGSALPGASDRLVLQDSAVPMKYNLDGLTNAITFLRKATFTGSVGLPDTNPAGYPEYRKTHLELNATAITIEGSRSDAPGQFRLKGTSGSACTVVYSGGSPASLGNEAVELYGLAASSVLEVTGGSVALAPKVGQTCAVGTWLAANASFRVGSGVTISGGATLQGVNAQLLSSWSGTLTLDGGTVTVGGTAAGTVVIESGTVAWQSTGNPGNSPVIGSGATLDLSQAPGTLTIGGTVQGYAGGTLNDANGRGGSYALKAVHCTLDEFRWVVPNDKTYSI